MAISSYIQLYPAIAGYARQQPSAAHLRAIDGGAGCPRMQSVLSALPLPLDKCSGRARRRREGTVGHAGESRSQPAVPPRGALKTALPLLHPASSCASETCADGRICSAACIAAIFAGGSIMNVSAADVLAPVEALRPSRAQGG